MKSSKTSNKSTKSKGKLDVMIDGMVVKINKVGPREDIGYTAKIPKWAVGFQV